MEIINTKSHYCIIWKVSRFIATTAAGLAATPPCPRCGPSEGQVSEQFHAEKGEAVCPGVVTANWVDVMSISCGMKPLQKAWNIVCNVAGAFWPHSRRWGTCWPFYTCGNLLCNYHPWNCPSRSRRKEVLRCMLNLCSLKLHLHTPYAF